MALSEPPARSLRPSRRDFLRLGGLGAAGLALAACGGGSSGGTPPAAAPSAGAAAAPGAFGEISMQLSWIKNIEFGGEYMADSKGYYTQAGFSKVDLVTGPVDSADALVVAGNVTVGVSAPDATARFITEQGAPLKIIGATFQKNPFCILSIEEGRPIRTLADLAGKTVGIQAGTNQQIFAGFLKANGIDPASVNQVVVQYEPTPLTEKNVDGFMAFLTNEPFLVKSQGFTPVTLAFADNGLPLASETLCVLQDTIDNDRDKLKAFLKAEVQGWNDAVADPEGSAKLAVDTYGKGLKLELDSQIEQMKAQTELVVTEDTKKNGLFTLTDELVTESIAAIASVGITITAEELFDLSLIKEVFAENPDLIKS
jgi:ABC-type nitrate/sulfonate/bicarbonate transport system substrate-binding protein